MAVFVLAVAIAGGMMVAGNRGFLSQEVSKQVVNQAFMEEMELVSSSRIAKLEAEFEPIFKAMPKNEHGNLDTSTVRYVIHRHFSHSFGWQVKGLRQEGESWNSSSSPSVMKNRVSGYILELFNAKLGGRGFDVNSLANYAALVEDMVHTEGTSVLARLFEVKNISMADPVGPQDLDELVSVVMAAFTLGEFELNSESDIKAIEHDIKDTAPRWSNTLEWISDVRLTLDWSNVHTSNPFREKRYQFNDGVDIVRKVLADLARHEMAECRAVKSALEDMDPHHLGRVTVAEYYESKEIDFHESMAYMRQMGILDETHANQPAVVIPNIVYSSGNCALVTDYYSVCCLDDCEGLMRSLEQQIAAPEASPARIVDVISNLGSDSVDAPRNLSALLLNRLDEVAKIHGGQVQLHGRLFMQWMHHAYPRECVFPHVSGTTKQLKEIEWAEWAGQDDAMASDEELQTHKVRDAKYSSLSRDELKNAIPWSTVEELVTEKRRAAPPSVLSKLRYVVGFCALASLLLPLVRSSKQTKLVDKQCVCV